MNQINKIGELSGLAILSHTVSDSLLSMGEAATFKPFAGLEGESLRGIGIPVSVEKMDGIIKRQTSFARRKRMSRCTNHIIYTPKEPQQFHQSVVTLVKNVTSDTFQTKLTPDVVLFITGKKSVWSNKGNILPKLTLEETIICTLAEFALDKFHTLNRIELKCSFYQGGEITWKSKY